MLERDGEWQGQLLMFLCIGQSLGLRRALQSVESSLLGISASAAKRIPVLVSALVFLLKIISVILHSAPLPARGRAAVCTCD